MASGGRVTGGRYGMRSDAATNPVEEISVDSQSQLSPSRETAADFSFRWVGLLCSVRKDSCRQDFFGSWPVNILLVG